MAIAIILASGLGKRMQAGKNKVLITLARKPIVYHTIKNFHDHDDIAQIVLVVRREEQSSFHNIVQKYGFDKVKDVIIGGEERQHSAHNAIMHLASRNIQQQEIVLFHNGANPFIADDEITHVISSAKKYGAAAVAHPTKDTIKEVCDDGTVVTTLDRAHLWNMQTPQAIKFSVARDAFSRAAHDGYLGTDDVSLVEYIGGIVKIIPASENNFKITTPRDLAVARLIMREHNN